jgi:hypothetical protein
LDPKNAVGLGWKPGKSSKFPPILATQETLTDFQGNEAKLLHYFASFP